MASRVFTDEGGRRWTVWEVHPTLAERRERNTGPQIGTRERRRVTGPRVYVPSKMADGWLAFESSDGERRRLAPIPEIPSGWDAASVDELSAWCAIANPAPSPRRLLE
jgi:hypothetical protein